MQFKEKTTTNQVAVFPTGKKRLKDAEVQTIHQIMDATRTTVRHCCEILYDYAELPGFIRCFKTEDVSMMCRSTVRNGNGEPGSPPHQERFCLGRF